MSVFMLYLKSTFAIILVMFWELTEIICMDLIYCLVEPATAENMKIKYLVIRSYFHFTLIFGIIEN